MGRRKKQERKRDTDRGRQLGKGSEENLKEEAAVTCYWVVE